MFISEFIEAEFEGLNAKVVEKVKVATLDSPNEIFCKTLECVWN